MKTVRRPPRRRPRHPMPADVRPLLRRGLMRRYRSRPPYQQNDYIGWITRARRPETRRKRIAKCWKNWSEAIAT
ncbi:MAG: YdeI/OmpD-associated family protein [Anaerolineales bacterium]